MKIKFLRCPLRHRHPYLLQPTQVIHNLQRAPHKWSFLLTFHVFLTFSRQCDLKRYVYCRVTNLIQDAWRETFFLTKNISKHNHLRKADCLYRRKIKFQGFIFTQCHLQNLWGKESVQLLWIMTHFFLLFPLLVPSLSSSLQHLGFQTEHWSSYYV